MPQDYTQDIRAGFANAARIISNNRNASNVKREMQSRQAAASVFEQTNLFSDDPALKTALMAGLRSGTLDPQMVGYVANMKKADAKAKAAAAQMQFANELAASKYALDVDKFERSNFEFDLNQIRMDATNQRLRAEHELDKEKHGWDKQKWHQAQADAEFDRQIKNEQANRTEARLSKRLGLDTRKFEQEKKEYLAGRQDKAQTTRLAEMNQQRTHRRLEAGESRALRAQEASERQQRFEEHKYWREQSHNFLDAKQHYDAATKMLRVYSPTGGNDMLAVLSELFRNKGSEGDGESDSEAIGRLVPEVPYAERPLIARQLRIATLKENIRTRQELGLVPLDAMRVVGDVQLGQVEKAINRFKPQVRKQLWYEFKQMAQGRPDFFDNGQMSDRGREWMQDRVLEHVSDGLSTQDFKTGNIRDWSREPSMTQYNEGQKNRQVMDTALKADKAATQFRTELDELFGLNEELGPTMEQLTDETPMRPVDGRVIDEDIPPNWQGRMPKPNEEEIRADDERQAFGAPDWMGLEEEERLLQQIRNVPDYVVPTKPEAYAYPGAPVPLDQPGRYPPTGITESYDREEAALQEGGTSQEQSIFKKAVSDMYRFLQMGRRR